MPDPANALGRLMAAAYAAQQKGVAPELLDACATILEAVTGASGARASAAAGSPAATASGPTAALEPGRGPRRTIRWENATQHALAIFPRLLGRKLPAESIVAAIREIFRERGEPEPSGDAITRMIEAAQKRSASAKKAWASRTPEQRAAWVASIGAAKKGKGRRATGEPAQER